jgi:hypothetical protein
VIDLLHVVWQNSGLLSCILKNKFKPIIKDPEL